MCWCFNFGFSSSKKPKASSSPEKKRRNKPDDTLHGHGRPVTAESSEKRKSSDTHRKRRSGETITPRSPRREREEHRPRSQRYHEDTYRQSRQEYRPSLNVQVPEMWHRTVEPDSVNSSQEALLNPRPHRSQHQRQRHPKRTSQTTLRGRGAKRDPPRHSKSKKNLRAEPSRGWSLFAPSPPKTPKREHRTYSTLESSPRSHRSSRHHRSPQDTSEPSSSRPQTRHRSSRQHDRHSPGSRQARSRTPNTAARRVPDRRFAVLAATNNALEEVRREAFAQPSPPPRRERLRRYEGVTIPTSQIPFNWDCVSSSQTSAGYGTTAGEPSSGRHRRSRR